jgi:hypothetical protein
VTSPITVTSIPTLACGMGVTVLASS